MIWVEPHTFDMGHSKASHCQKRKSVYLLTHWGRVTHICVVKQTIIGSDNGLSPGRRQAIIWTNAGILLIGPLGTNFIKILIGIQTLWFNKMHLKMSSPKWRPFCLGLNVLTHWGRDKMAAIFQTTFSIAFYWITMYELRMRFHWSLFSKGEINNIPALVQIVAWRRPGDKPLSETMMVSLLTHMCVTWLGLNELTDWLQGDVAIITKVWFPNSLYWVMTAWPH